jgi:glycosyltransferase involved in cell wall biosynthesis
MNSPAQVPAPENKVGLLSIVVPVYNEGKNFPALWAQLSSKICSPFRAYVVYDFDADDTVPVVQGIIECGEGKLRLIKNSIKRGVVGAIMTGFQQVESGPVLVVMADLSDDLAQVDRMVELYSSGFQVVVGSRYMPGGSIEGGPLLKKSLSRLAGLTLCWLRGVPTHDATNAFKIYDCDMVRSFQIESQKGFELNLELTVKAFLAGYRITEIPSSWKDRTHGQSRFDLWGWLPHYLKWYFYAFRKRHWIQTQKI